VWSAWQRMAPVSAAQTVTVMSLNHVVELLIKDDGSISRYHRAISLFEFQVAIYHPSSFERLVATQGGVRAPTGILRTARIYAAIKILEKIEADLKHQNNVSVMSIRELAADENYQSVFDDVIATNGGWHRIRQSMTARELDDNIDARRDEAQVVANIVDFSYRFSKHLANAKYPGRKSPGGVDAAKYVVRKAYKPHISRSTMKNRWREYKLPAIFLYLTLNQKFDVWPCRVSSKEFPDALLQQVGNTDELRRYFCAYQTVRAALLDRKYKLFPVLDLDLGCSPRLENAEFSPDISRAFEAWINCGAT
jgi:hypothetical protein